MGNNGRAGGKKCCNNRAGGVVLLIITKEWKADSLLAKHRGGKEQSPDPATCALQHVQQQHKRSEMCCFVHRAQACGNSTSTAFSFRPVGLQNPEPQPTQAFAPKVGDLTGGGVEQSSEGFGKGFVVPTCLDSEHKHL